MNDDEIKSFIKGRNTLYDRLKSIKGNANN